MGENEQSGVEEVLIVEGGKPLQGAVRPSGAKNAALPILAAALLADGRSVIENVPDLSDVRLMLAILRELGCRVEHSPDGTVECDVLDASDATSVASYELVSKMRASFCVLGPLLARRGWARVSLPGGCSIGLRPVDLHLKGLEALGAEIHLERGYVEARAPGGRLRGARIYLGGANGSSVLGTEHIMMAAALAEGKSVIECAACEPEIEDLAKYLNAMGATITGAGTPRITVTGVPSLRGARHRVIPDRIEAGTFLIGAAMTGGCITVEEARSEHLPALFDTLRRAGRGLEISEGRGGIRIERDPDAPRPKSFDVTTLPYPGYPTDLQAQAMAYLSVADGIGVITEKVFPDRYQHLAELARMGAKVRKEGNCAIVAGVGELTGAPVRATDLRASAALVLAGLVAKGETHVHHLHHLDRGYERFVEKLAGLGANLRRVPIDEAREVQQIEARTPSAKFKRPAQPAPSRVRPRGGSGI